MTALYIIGAVIAFILLILLSTVRIIISYDDGFVIKLRYWFISYTLFPITEKEKKQVERTADEAEKNVDKDIGKSVKKHGYLKTFNDIKALISPVLNEFKAFAAHITVKPFIFRLVMVSDDAATLAIQYGAFCPVFYSSLAALESAVKMKKVDSNISVDYLKTDFELELKATVKFRLIFAAKSAVKILSEIVKLKNSQNKSQERVVKNERKH